MSVQEPPNPFPLNPIFNPNDWVYDDRPLTIAEADTRYLRFPTAQGTENLQTINVNGLANFNNTITANGITNFTNTSQGSLTSSATQPSTSDSSTKIPTTEWVQSVVAAIPTPTSLISSNNTWTGTNDFTNSSPITSSATMPSTSDSSTKIPTTAWIQSVLGTIPLPSSLLSSNNTWTGTNDFTNSSPTNFYGDVNIFKPTTAGGSTGQLKIHDINGSNNYLQMYQNGTTSEIIGAASNGIVRIYAANSSGAEKLLITTKATGTSIQTNKSDSGSNSQLLVVESGTGKCISFYADANDGNYNPIVQGGDAVIYSDKNTGSPNTENIALTTHSSTTNGVRITPTTTLVGAGGNADTPTNNIAFNSGTTGIVLTSQTGTTVNQLTPARTTVPQFQVDNGSKSIWLIADTTGGEGNPIVTSGDNTVISKSGIPLTITAQSATTNGIRLTNASAEIGAGGTGATPTCNTLYSSTGQVITTSTAGTIIQSADISANATLEVKESTTGYATLFIPRSDGGQYNPLDTANANEIVSIIEGQTRDNGQILAIVPHSATSCGIKMNAGTGGSGTNASILMGCGGSGATPTNYFLANGTNSIIAGTASFTSTTPPISSQTIPSYSDSSNKIPTTAWVQGLVSTIPSPISLLSSNNTWTGTNNFTNTTSLSNNLTQTLNNTFIQEIATTNDNGNVFRKTDIYGDLNIRRPTSANSGAIRAYDIVSNSGYSLQLYQSGLTTNLIDLAPNGTIQLKGENSGATQRTLLTSNATNGTIIETNKSDSGSNAQLRVAETGSGKCISFYADGSAGNYNPIVQNGDGVIFTNTLSNSNNTENLVLTTHGSTNTGVRITPTNIIIGAGGTTTTPITAITFNGVNTIISGAASFTATNPPTSSQTLPAPSDSSNKIPTTAWVQSAISAIPSPSSLLSSNNTWTGTNNFTNAAPITSTAVMPSSSDSSTKIPTTAWVQSAISSTPQQFVPKFVNYTDVQTTSGQGYSNGPTINFNGAWAINDIAYFRIVSQVSYNKDGNGAYQNTGNSMGVMLVRPYYMQSIWGNVSNIIVSYCNNSPSSVMGADRRIAYYTPCYNTGGVQNFIITGGVKNMKFGVLSFQANGGWEYFVSVEYMGARCSSGCTVTFSNGTDITGINDSLP